MARVRPAFDPVLPDLARMHVERTRRLRAAMCDESLDAMVLSGSGNIQYAAGASSLPADPGRAVAEPTTAVVTHDEVHLFTSYPEGVPRELSTACIHGPVLVEFPAGVRELAARLADLIGRGSVRVGFDELTAASLEVLPSLLPSMEIVDASVALAPAKLVKTADEVQCIRRAQHLNETAMHTMLETFRPGIRQSELTGRFVELVHGLGGANTVDPLWQVTPPSIADGPWALHGDVAFPVASTDRIIGTGDMVIVDTGIHLDGYCSDFGRTWWAGDGLVPPRAREHFARWCDVMTRVFDVIAPGVASSELRHAAERGETGRRPWLEHYYLVHGLGTQGSELPFVGTDLGVAYEDALVLQPGMVMVLEPVIWEDGHGGFRAEEIVVVTEDGFEMLSDSPHPGFADEGVRW